VGVGTLLNLLSAPRLVGAEADARPDPAGVGEVGHPASTRKYAWAWILLSSTLAVELATLFDAPALVRGPLVLWFCLFCTGMAWVRLLRLEDRLAAAVAAVALSVAMSGLTATALLYSGHASANLTMLTLEAFTMIGVFLDVTLGRRT